MPKELKIIITLVSYTCLLVAFLTYNYNPAIKKSNLTLDDVISGKSFPIKK